MYKIISRYPSILKGRGVVSRQTNRRSEIMQVVLNIQLILIDDSKLQQTQKLLMTCRQSYGCCTTSISDCISGIWQMACIYEWLQDPTQHFLPFSGKHPLDKLDLDLKPCHSLNNCGNSVIVIKRVINWAWLSGDLTYNGNDLKPKFCLSCDHNLRIYL